MGVAPKADILPQTIKAFKRIFNVHISTTPVNKNNEM